MATKVLWSQVPEPVQKEAHHFVNGSPSAETRVEKGETVYHFSGGKNGKHNDVDISAAGKFIYLEQHLGLGSCPKPVQNVFRQQANGGKIEQVTRFVDNEQTTFEAEITKNDKSTFVEVDGKGKVLSVETETDLAQLPVPAQATIKAELNAAKITYLGKVVEGGDVSFHIEAANNDKEFEFFVADDGDLLRRELTLFETPAAVQKAILARMGNSPDLKVVKDCEAHDCQFTVEFNGSTNEHSLVVEMNGALVSESEVIRLAQAPAPVQKLIQETTAGATVGSITKTQESDSLYYEIEVTRDDNDESFEATADGKILD
ncbi:MAG: hypothetical protein ACXWIU_09160 [Limisphaerales bacterium]